MKTYYKFDNTIIKKILSINLGLVIFVVLFFILVTNDLNTILFFSLAVFVLITLPAILVLYDYYKENKDVYLAIDIEKKQFIIKKYGKTFDYKFEDVKSSTYVFGYFSKTSDNNKRIPILFLDLGYWNIEFNDGENFNITILLYDLINLSPILKETKSLYTLYPLTRIFQSIKRKDYGYGVISDDGKGKIRLQRLEENLKKKKVDDLRYILNNKEKYQTDTIKIVEKILNKKTLGNNAQKKLRNNND